MVSAPFTEVVVKAVRVAVGIITVCGGCGCGEGGGGQLHHCSRWGWVVQGLVVVAMSLMLKVVAASTTQVARW